MEIVARVQEFEPELWRRFEEQEGLSFEELVALVVPPEKSIREVVERLIDLSDLGEHCPSVLEDRRGFARWLAGKSFFGGSLGNFLSLALCLTQMAQELDDPEWNLTLDEWLSRVEDSSSHLREESKKRLAGAVLDRCRLRLFPDEVIRWE